MLSFSCTCVRLYLLVNSILTLSKTKGETRSKIRSSIEVTYTKLKLIFFDVVKRIEIPSSGLTNYIV